jgi:peroxiredoxin
MDSKPFALIGVNTNGITADKLKQVMDKEKLSWRSFADPRDEKQEGFARPVCDQWNLEGTPSMYVLDHKGVIRYKWFGPREKDIDAAIAKLLKEAEQDERKESK